MHAMVWDVLGPSELTDSERTAPRAPRELQRAYENGERKPALELYCENALLDSVHPRYLA